MITITVVDRVHVRRENRLVFAAQNPGDLRREAAEDLAVRIDEKPFLRDVVWRCRERFHCYHAVRRDLAAARSQSRF